MAEPSRALSSDPSVSSQGWEQSKSPPELQGSAGLTPVLPVTPGPHGPWDAGVLVWGLWGQGTPIQLRIGGLQVLSGSRGVPDSPPGGRAAAPGVASAGAASAGAAPEPAGLSPAQHPVLAPSGPRRGGGAAGPSPRAARWGN